jgi:hypothetical protein
MGETQPKQYSRRDAMKFAGRALIGVGAATMGLGTIDTLNSLKVRKDIEDQVDEFAPPLSNEQIAQGEIDRDDFIRDSHEYYLTHPDEGSIPVTDPEGLFNAAFTQEYPIIREKIILRQQESAGVTDDRAFGGLLTEIAGGAVVVTGWLINEQALRQERAARFDNHIASSPNPAESPE